MSPSNCQLERSLSLRQTFSRLQEFPFEREGKERRREVSVSWEEVTGPPPIPPKLSSSRVWCDRGGLWLPGGFRVADGTNRVGHYRSPDQTNKLTTSGKRNTNHQCSEQTFHEGLWQNGDKIFFLQADKSEAVCHRAQRAGGDICSYERHKGVIRMSQRFTVGACSALIPHVGVSLMADAKEETCRN